MLKTAKFLFVSTVVAVSVAQPAFAKSYDDSNWRQTKLYDIVSPSPEPSPTTFDPSRAGGGSLGYNVDANENY